eukprot:647823-Pelagomonas_calceolata.AAC.3
MQQHAHVISTCVGSALVAPRSRRRSVPLTRWLAPLFCWACKRIAKLNTMCTEQRTAHDGAQRLQMHAQGPKTHAHRTAACVRNAPTGDRAWCCAFFPFP